MSYYLIIETNVLLYFWASGLRSFAASVLFILALYMKNKKKNAAFIVVNILAIGMHNVIIIPTIFYLIQYYLKKNKMVMLGCLVWGVFAQIISEFLLFSHNAFINYIGLKIHKYLYDVHVNIDIRYYLIQIIVLILLTIYYYKLTPKNNNILMEYMLLFNYGCVFNYTFFERILRINVFLSIFIFGSVKKRRNECYYTNIVLVLIATLMLIYQIINVRSNMRFT